MQIMDSNIITWLRSKSTIKATLIVYANEYLPVKKLSNNKYINIMKSKINTQEKSFLVMNIENTEKWCFSVFNGICFFSRDEM